jgi:hypothetical protein
MLTLDEAFRKFRSRLELNDREQSNASSRHQEMREHLRGDFALDDDFLTGSYRRHTKTKPLKDVDILLCAGTGREKHYRDEHPTNVLAGFREIVGEEVRL